MQPTPDEVAAAVNQLADEYRVRCLWFLRTDYYPTTREQRRKVLNYIQTYGDHDAFIRAGKLHQWL